MRALPQAFRGWGERAIRLSRGAALPLACLALSALVAVAARDMAMQDWSLLGSQAERLGARYGLLVRQAELVERASHASSDPGATFEYAIPGNRTNWRYVSRGNVAFTFLGDWVSGTYPPQGYETKPYDGGPAGGTYTLTRLRHVGERPVVMLQGVDCSKLLSLLSSYTLGRVRAAWDIGDDDLDRGTDAVWGPVGQARTTCQEGAAGKPGDRTFLLRFEPPRQGDVAPSEIPG